MGYGITRHDGSALLMGFPGKPSMDPINIGKLIAFAMGGRG
jgi:hypothetical protein